MFKKAKMNRNRSEYIGLVNELEACETKTMGIKDDIQ